MDDPARRRASAAKARAKAAIGDRAEIVGIGLTRRDGGYALKVNLGRPAAGALPDAVEGVPVVYEVVGRIAKRGT